MMGKIDEVMLSSVYNVGGGGGVAGGGGEENWYAVLVYSIHHAAGEQ